eukprot:jgi/Psemu1/303015/fgenesh1_kg.89_\
MSKERVSSPPSSNTRQREWDLVIHGATGDAGTAVAMYIANNVDSYNKRKSDNGNHNESDISVFRWSPDVGAFTLPDFMGWCNIPVVCNSCSSIDCTYHNRIATPYSQGCLWTGYGLLQTLIFYVFLLATAPIFLCFQTLLVLVPATSELILKVFDAFQYRGNTPQNQAMLENSTVDFWTYATSALSGSQARVHLHINGDAGIKCTALLACETAFSMLELEDADNLPRGVIGSPSMIAGDALVDRLQDEEAIAEYCTLSVTVLDGSSGNHSKKEN